jgi:hypothetical protein
MNPNPGNVADVMQVCRNGHVITDRLHSNPESGRTHCDRCGAATLDRCLTCGHELPGALDVCGLVPIGAWQTPRHCLMCGAAFPWVRRPHPAPEPLTLLDGILRRLPPVIRQLRWRQGDRPPLRIDDDRDLEDLVRALLPLHFDDVRIETRTPLYSPGTRTDLILAPAEIALTMKYARSSLPEPKLLEQWQEDVAYYRRQSRWRMLVGFIYDPEGVLRDGKTLEKIWSDIGDGLPLHRVVCA